MEFLSSYNSSFLIVLVSDCPGDGFGGPGVDFQVRWQLWLAITSTYSKTTPRITKTTTRTTTIGTSTSGRIWDNQRRGQLEMRPDETAPDKTDQTRLDKTGPHQTRTAQTRNMQTEDRLTRNR